MMWPWPVLLLFAKRIYCAGACCEVCVTMPYHERLGVATQASYL